MPCDLGVGRAKGAGKVRRRCASRSQQTLLPAVEGPSYALLIREAPTPRRWLAAPLARLAAAAATNGTVQNKGFLRTALSSTAARPARVYGLDCEMVNCGAALNVLARVTLVSE